jgi:AcrR family transcriptional regulator
MRSLPQHLSKVPVGREAISRETLASFHRERIVTAATGVFAKRGYQATTVEHIVAAAKTSVGNFYQQFENKEDCFLGVLDSVIAVAHGRLLEALAGKEDWSLRAYVGLATLLEIYAEDPFAARIVLIEAQTAGEVATARYNALGDAAASWLRQGRRDYPAAARLPETFEQAAVSGTAYFLHQRLLDAEDRSAAALLGETASLVLEPIVGPDQLRKLATAATLD